MDLTQSKSLKLFGLDGAGFVGYKAEVRHFLISILASAAMLLPTMVFALVPDGEVAVLFEALSGSYVSEAGNDARCPSQLEVKRIVNLDALLVVGLCGSRGKSLSECTLTPWQTRNQGRYAELFMDVNQGEVITDEEGIRYRLTTTAQAGELKLERTESDAHGVVRVVMTGLRQTEWGLEFTFSRTRDAAYGELELVCPMARTWQKPSISGIPGF